MQLFIKTPHYIFLIDGVGALLTAFSLFSVLRPFHGYIGFSPSILLTLSIIALVFSGYSLLNFFFFHKNWKPYLNVICYANISYCILTAALMLYYFQQLKIIGLLYFTGEIMVILVLVGVEFKTLKVNVES